MLTIKELVNLVQKYMNDHTSQLTAFFCCSTALKKSLSSLKSALIEFDDIKYVPEDSNDKRREKALEKISVLLNACFESIPDSDASLITTIRDTISKNLDYYSRDNINQSGIRYVYWSGPDQELADELSGIGIAVNDPRPQSKQKDPYPTNFETAVIINLNYLYQTKAGKILLDSLIEYSAKQTAMNGPERISILPTGSKMGNNISHQSPNQVMHSVANELIAQISTFPNNILAALAQANKGYSFEEQVKWLVEQINQMPEFKYQCELSNKPFLSPEQQVKATDIIGWLSGKGAEGWKKIYQHPEDVRQHIINTTIAVLTPFAIPNVGGGSFIRWNPSPEYATNQKRPPAIGLAHELIHAYFNSKGMQPGAQESDPTTVLFEYITVGLGLWRNNELSENAIREQWNQILSQIPAEDALNARAIAERLFYSEPEPEQSNDLKLNALGTGI